MKNNKKEKTHDELKDIVEKYGLKMVEVQKNGFSVVYTNKPTINNVMVTAVLSNGVVVRVPLKNCKEIVEKMEENIKRENDNKNL